MFLHENWDKAGFIEKFKSISTKRNLKDQTISPVMTWSNDRLEKRVSEIKKVQGVSLVFGGSKIDNPNQPKQYGLFQPTLFKVPLEAFADKANFDILTDEVFGPVSLVVVYKDNELNKVLEIMEKIDNHLTAGVVSNDIRFLNKVLGNTVNGVTYSGIKGRTTGAPQNHWFGPAGDPRAAGIGTIEAIKYVWSCHREIIMDSNEVNPNIKLVQS
jgi:1-pyrroline-5-carboxylate dehydrogenase